MGHLTMSRHGGQPVPSGLLTLEGGRFSAGSRGNGILDMEDTCGIIGVVSRTDKAIEAGTVPNASKYLVEGLSILQNRGYDSAGICTMSSEKKSQALAVSKFASLNTTSDALDRLKRVAFGEKHGHHNVGIAHTRWATHGGKTDANAHPHTDQKGRIALAHNGIIENATALRHELIKNYGIKFQSETDTEVIAQLIGVLMDKGSTFIEAIQDTVARLEGTWGLVVVCPDEPSKIVAVRNGSPMVIGLAENATFIASEPSAFSRYAKEIINLDNGEIAVITADGVSELISSTNSKKVKDRVQLFEEEDVELTPAPYPYWTIKEIMEQPQAISRSLNFGGRFVNSSKVKLGGLEQNKNWLLKIRHLVIAACGTSLHAGLYGARIFRRLKCFDSVQVIDAAELSADDFPPNHTGLLVISQSGETQDVMRSLAIAQDINVPAFSIVNKAGSLIARTTGCGVYINAGHEHAVASTKAFTCQVTVLALVGLFFAQHRPQSSIQQRQGLIADLHRLPISIGMMLNEVRNKCKQVATKLANANTLFILGKGFGDCIARESSLKIKEIAYIHAEAYSSGALKHGPFALIEENTPIIMLMLDDVNLTLNITAANEVKSRGAFVIAISDCAAKVSGHADIVIPIPSGGMLTGVLAVVPLQLVAYEVSVLRGYSPDKPRNLAKTVTVV